MSALAWAAMLHMFSETIWIFHSISYAVCGLRMVLRTIVFTVIMLHWNHLTSDYTEAIQTTVPHLKTCYLLNAAALLRFHFEINRKKNYILFKYCLPFQLFFRWYLKNHFMIFGIRNLKIKPFLHSFLHCATHWIK